MQSPSRLVASSRNSRGKSPRISYGAKFLPPTTFSISSMNLSTQLLALVQVLRSAAYPECRCQNTTGISRTVGVHTPAVIPGNHNCRHSSSPHQSIMLYENLTYTPPAAIALNYSVKNIRNDVRQKIIIIIFDEKSQFNSLVWGLLTLAPITLSQDNSMLLNSKLTWCVN